MNALLLSAGLGERLRPLTDDMPKCLLPMTDKGTMLQYWIETLISLGVDKIFIDVFWAKDKIIQYVNGIDDYHRNNIIIYDETRLEPVGEVIYNLRDQLGSQFLIINSDTHIKKEKVNDFIATASVSAYSPVCIGISRQDCRGKSCLQIDKDNMVRSFVEKPRDEAFGWVYAGIALMDRMAIYKTYRTDIKLLELTKDIFPTYVDKMFAFDIGQIIDIGGSLEEYEQARKTLG